MNKEQINWPPQIIAGPCAAETEDQVVSWGKQLAKLGVDCVRANLWKPRTEPGFEGMGESGLPWLNQLSNQGIAVATEVILPQHVDLLINNLRLSPPGPLLVWLGSRNQNHLIQQDITRALKNAPDTTLLMIKNQPWPDLRHWLGIVKHVLAAGFPENRLLLCHRGHTPHPELPNPQSLRNLPDLEMVSRAKEETGLPIILDPSHIGGTRSKVLSILKDLLPSHIFDGVIIEAHPNPPTALTDAKQQLDLEEMRQALQIISTLGFHD